MKILKVKIDTKQYAKYNSQLGEMLRKNTSIFPDRMDYEFALPNEHEDLYIEKTNILLDGKGKVYTAEKNLSEVQVNTMLAIVFNSVEDYKEVYNNNSESVYVGRLIDACNVYSTFLDQIYNSDMVKAEFFISNTLNSGKKSKVVLEDDIIKKKALTYLKEIYRSKVLTLCQEIEATFEASIQAFELLNQCKYIANSDKINSVDQDLIVLVEPLLKALPKYEELKMAYESAAVNRPKKVSDRQGIFLRHVYANLQRFLEEDTEISKSYNPGLKSSEQHRVIHYICAIAGIVPFQSEIKQQAQTVKDILRIRD